MRARKDPSYPMNILKGEAVEYIANGTYSSIIRLVVTSDTPQPKPDIVRLMQITEKYMNWVITAPTKKMKPVISSVLRLPFLSIMPALRAPTQAPIL